MWRFKLFGKLARIWVQNKLHLVSTEAFSAVLSDHMIAERAEWRMTFDALDNIVLAQGQELRQLRETVHMMALRFAKQDVEALERGTLETNASRK